jgi:hypothetical protein
MGKRRIDAKSNVTTAIKWDTTNLNAGPKEATRKANTLPGGMVTQIMITEAIAPIAIPAIMAITETTETGTEAITETTMLIRQTQT